MAANASFAATPRFGLANVVVANPNRDGTGTLVDVFIAGASGSRVDKVGFQAAATTTAGMIRWFLNDGTNTRLILEQAVSAVTGSATLPETLGSSPALELANGVSGVFPMILPSGWRIKASTEKAESINVWAQGGDF
jgi:hypothetical protein